MTSKDKAFDYYLRIVVRLNRSDITNGGWCFESNQVIVHNSVAQMSFTVCKPLQPQLDRWFRLWVD